MKRSGVIWPVMRYGIIFLIGLCLLMLSACRQRQAANVSGIGNPIDSLIPKYSHSFRVDYYQGYRLVQVYGQDRKLLASYLLYADSTSASQGSTDAIRLHYPAHRVVCMSTTHIGAMGLLDGRNLIAATTNKALICDSMVRDMIDAGTIKDAGKDYQPDYEVIAGVRPDLLFCDGENTGSSQLYAKLRAMGVKVVASRDYFEQEPLARAEWIKFFAAFIGREKLADSLFKRVETSYLAEKAQASSYTHRPTVFCNVPYSGVWYMPCGSNYIARLITDAGGRFLWNDNKPTNGLNLTLNFEQVYQRAAEADIWLNTGVYTTVKQVTDQDAKFKLFKAYKTGSIYNCTRRMSPGGGMEIWELGSFLPNLVLHDLNTIFHQGNPSLDSLYYYKALR